MATRRLRLGSYDLKEVGLAALFLTPSLVVFSLFFYWPFARLLSWGAYEPVQRGASYRNVGFSNYADVIGSQDFRSGLWISTKYVFITVPAGLVLGVLLAVAAHRRLRGIKFFQTVFSSTIATSVAVAAVVFFVLINPEIGVIKTDLLSDPSRALFGVGLVTIWKNMGLAFVICLAGLQAIPEEVLEAARLDGFGAFRRFFTVTLPMMGPVMVFLVVVLVISAFQEFAPMDILTSGGPARSTETMVFKVFQRQNPQNITVGAVMAVGLFVITVVVTLGQFLLLERRVHYGD